MNAIAGMIIHTLGMGLLLALSAFFSGAETALFSLSRTQVRRMSKGSRGERAVTRLLHDPQRILSTIVVGNMIVNVMLASMIASLVQKRFGDHAVTAAIGISTMLLLVFGEVTPKTIAVRYAPGIAVFVALPLTMLGIIFTPVRLLLRTATDFILRLLGQARMRAWGSVTKDEIAAMLAIGEAEGATTGGERLLISNILNLGALEAHDIMVPRTELSGLDDELTVAEAFAVASEHRHSRLPVYHEDLDDSWGIFSIIDMPESDDTEILGSRLRDLRGHLHNNGGAPYPGRRRPVCAALLVPETVKVEKLLHQMREQHVSVVLLVDEYGGTAGLLTLDDILAEIVGHISPVGKAERAGIIFAEDHILVEGRTHLRALNDVLDAKLLPNGADTIGGYVMELLGRVPRAGEKVADRHYQYQVIKMAGRRIGTLRLDKIETPYEKEEGE